MAVRARGTQTAPRKPTAWRLAPLVGRPPQGKSSSHRIRHHHKGPIVLSPERRVPEEHGVLRPALAAVVGGFGDRAAVASRKGAE